MSFKKSLIAGVALLGMPSLALAADATGTITTSINVTAPLAGCVVTDPNLTLTSIAQDTTEVSRTTNGVLSLRCTGSVTPAAITLTKGGVTDGGGNTALGHSSDTASMIVYTMSVTSPSGSPSTAYNVPNTAGTSSGDLSAYLSSVTDPNDTTISTHTFDVSATAALDNVYTKMNSIGTYSATTTVEVTYSTN